MTIRHRITEILHSIQTTQATYHQTHPITLVAVTKGVTIQAMQDAFEAGIQHFGESYVQEALEKTRILQGYPLIWHFIGPIQTNKAKKIARHFDWVHSVSRYEIAAALNQARPLDKPPLNICLQVNLDKEPTKTGVFLEKVPSLANAICALPRLKLRGLMLLPPYIENEEQQYHSFMRLSGLLKILNQTLPISLDTLSMGMSQDQRAAIRAGSTMLRIGQAIFGIRPTT